MTTAETKTLYFRWYHQRKTMVPEWAENFEAFKAWCEANGWTPSHRVARPRRGVLLGPETARLTDHATHVAKVRNGPVGVQNPGWENRPCAECLLEECQTARTCPCRAYLAWWNVTMAAYRRALMGKEET